MAMALFLASCSQSDEPSIVNKDKGSPAVMTINFNNPAPEGRAVGAPVNESNITDGTVMIFRSSTGVLDGMKTFTSVASPITVPITAGTRDVYVVANTGLDFSLVQNVSDLKNLTTKYALSSISATGTALPMSGSVLNQNATAATTTNHATATVQMTYMCSKVKISWDLTALNANMTNFTVTGAYIMNVPSETDCFAFGSDNLTTYCQSFVTGLNNPSTFNTGFYYPVTPYTNAYDANLALTSPASNSGNNFFYIFENKLAAHPTIVVVQATVQGNSGTTTYYYPIVINGTQNTNSGDGTATVLHGKYYSVTAKIKGFGNDDPYDPVVNAFMDVTITLPAWGPIITIDETFE